MARTVSEPEEGEVVEEDLVAYARLADGSKVKLTSSDPLPDGVVEADVERLFAAGVLEEQSGAPAVTIPPGTVGVREPGDRPGRKAKALDA